MGLIRTTFGGSETPQDAQPHTEVSRTELKISLSKRQKGTGGSSNVQDPTELLQSIYESGKDSYHRQRENFSTPKAIKHK